MSRRRDFAWLGVLPEDVTLTPAMTATLWETDERSARTTLRSLWDKALLLPGALQPNGTPTYRLHDLLHDLARRLLTTPSGPTRPDDLPGLGLTLREAHGRLLERYRARTRGGLWHTLPDDGYIHAHLTWHLEQAGAPEGLHGLLREDTTEGRNGWYEARERLGQVAGYLSDVDRAWRLAEKAFADRRSSLALGLQCRYAVIITSLNSLAINIPLKLLVTLVDKRVWSPAQGLSFARQVPDVGQRAKALALLIPLLAGPEQDQALRVAIDAIESGAYGEGRNGEEDRVEVLAAMVPCLTEPSERDQVLRGVGTITGMAKLAPHLSEPRLAEVVDLTRHLDEETRCKVLTSLALHLTEPLLAKAHDLVCRIPDYPSLSFSVSSALAALAFRRAELLGQLAEALEAARAIGYQWFRSRALVALAPRLTEPLLREALDVARTIDREEYRAEALAALASHLTEPSEREQALREALDVARMVDHPIDLKMQYDGNRAEALAALAPHLTEPLLREALDVARTIDREEYRAEALAALASHLTEPSEREQALREALDVARRIDREEYRAEALAALASHLTEPSEREQALHEALDAAVRAISEDGYRYEMPRILAPHLAELGRPAEALDAVRAICGGYGDWVKILEALAPRLAELGHQAEALDAVRAISHDYVYYEYYQEKALAALVPHLTEPRLTEVLALAISEDRQWSWSEALAALAPRLAELGHPVEALEAARAIGYEGDRSQALAALAPHLTEPLLREALEAARAIGDEENRSEVLAALASSLAPTERDQALREALEAARAIGYEGDRSQALAALAPHLTEPLLREALEAARAIGDEENRSEVLAALASSLAPTERDQALREALEAARAIGYEEIRSRALVALAPRLTEPLLREALDVARTIDREQYRSRALAALAPSLGPTERDRALREALEAVRAIRYEGDRSQALAALAPHLTEPLLGEALEAARAIEKWSWSRSPALAALAPRLAQLGHPAEALETARAIGYEGDRSQALATLAPRLVELGHPAEALEAARAIRDEGDRSQALAALAPQLAELTPATLSPLWSRTLRLLATGTREGLLGDLCVLVPVLAALGGAEAVAETFRAIQDVGRWWP